MDVIRMRGTHSCDGLRGKGTRKPQPSPAYLVFFVRCAQDRAFHYHMRGSGHSASHKLGPAPADMCKEWWRVGG